MGRTSTTLDVSFSSGSDDWSTPQDFFDELDRTFQFGVDLAASHENTKCGSYLIENSLETNWSIYSHTWCWLNPPYSNIKDWVIKADKEAELGTNIVMLIPARVDTKWYQDYIKGKWHHKFIRGRLKFGGSKHNAPFPSMLVFFSKALQQ